MFRRLQITAMAFLLLLACVAGYSQTLAPYPTAKLSVSGTETQTNGVWPSGNIAIDFNGYLEIVNYGQYSSAASLASALAASFTRDYISMGLYAKAGANGPLVDPTVVTFQLVNGNTFAPINIVASSSPFSFATSGFSASSATVADRGTATLTVAGTTVTANYGDGSTAATIAQDLALKARSPLVTVTAEGSNLYLQSKQTTGSFNYPYSLSFSTATSFSSSSGSGTLTGSTDAAPVTVYSYSVTNSSGQSGYDNTGNVTNVTDSVMGTWTYTYDNVNRLMSGTATSGPYAGQSTCWSYDSFGNRTSQYILQTPCPTTLVATTQYSANNQISLVTSPANMTISYDPRGGGNVTNDGYNAYVYDAENRICAVQGPEGTIGYQYDADGNRVSKGTITTMSCDLTQNGYQPIVAYVLDQSGGQMSEVAIGNGQSNWKHTNITANGMLIATNDTSGLHFYLNDALGSRRAQTDSAGFPEQTCQSLPFGDQLYCSASLSSPTEHHFTGKERDSESGLDYFGARYMSSNLGRFMSPDPLYLEMHRLTDPQQLNLYSYVRNNPLSLTDPDGHDIALHCDDNANCATATDQVNGRKDGQFKVSIGDDGKWHPVGNVDTSKLSGAEKAFYGALTDTSTHATLTAVSGDGGVLFGLNTGKGTNTVDVADTAQLAGAGLSPGSAVAHEAMEAYATAGGSSLQDAHNNDPFPGFTLLGGAGNAVVSNGNVTGYTYNLRYNGASGGNYQVRANLKTPIPVSSFMNPQTRADAQRAVGTTQTITSVTQVKPQ